ncbi:hypothetical protein [Bacillus sp. SJS]|uniref:hypothetical protein n=1 Tax=Bacillus sp. SJS TaxID=1423321 RepID=UPI0004DD6BE3|nr:hypothetical protein [Bacillus sp. SJS]KZZ83461.1 cytosolic protein [Bacillus sp. SJS]
METFTVAFHKEDETEDMTVYKLSEEDFAAKTEGGTRHLFELDTNVGYFVFFDAEDKNRNESYLVLQYEENEEDPVACYGFELKDFYQFTALYLNDLEFSEEQQASEGDEEVYGPIHHLAHLMFHIAEAGNKTA